MKKHSVQAVFISFLFLLTFQFLKSAHAAGDFQWSGLYRIEGISINNSELDGDNREKSYGVHHLVLRPKIIAADGLNISARFDIFNNNSAGLGTSVLGQVWGSGAGNLGAGYSNAASETQKPEDLIVTELYLSFIQEFGALVVGRVPLQFGLGASYSAGRGMFDHWIDTRDLVGYKVVMGNMYLMPMYGKVNEGKLHRGTDDVSDIMIQFEYDNPETDLVMGLFYSNRKSSVGGNDAPTGANGYGEGGTTIVADEALDAKQYSVFVQKQTEQFKFAVEASFLNGKTGVSADGESVNFNGFGIAGEVEWNPQASKMRYGAKFGYATGDDPTTIEYEGFIFDRNYDVAMLMFNHPLGQANFLRTGLIGGHPSNPIAEPDTEAISNAIYLAPSIEYQWKEQWSLKGVLALGMLNEDPLDQKVDKNLGYEFDFSLIFRPNDRVTWINEVGLLFPGEAFKGGTNDFDTSFAYGFGTKAAISF